MENSKPAISIPVAAMEKSKPAIFTRTPSQPDSPVGPHARPTWEEHEVHDVLLDSVWLDWRNLQNCPASITGDRAVIERAIRNSRGDALMYAARRLQSDHDLVLSAARLNGLTVQYAGQAVRDDRLFMLQVCALDGKALKYASARLQDDFELVRTAVENTGDALTYASERLLGDLKLLLLATETNKRRACMINAPLILPSAAPLPPASMLPAALEAAAAAAHHSMRQKEAILDLTEPRRPLAVESLQRHKGENDYDTLTESFGSLAKDLKGLEADIDRRIAAANIASGEDTMRII